MARRRQSQGVELDQHAVPDGDDYVEFMLYRKTPDKFGTKNHISLEVPDVAKSVAILEARPAFKTYGKELRSLLASIRSAR